MCKIQLVFCITLISVLWVVHAKLFTHLCKIILRYHMCMVLHIINQLIVGSLVKCFYGHCYSLRSGAEVFFEPYTCKVAFGTKFLGTQFRVSICHFSFFTWEGFLFLLHVPFLSKGGAIYHLMTCHGSASLQHKIVTGDAANIMDGNGLGWESYDDDALVVIDDDFRMEEATTVVVETWKAHGDLWEMYLALYLACCFFPPISEFFRFSLEFLTICWLSFLSNTTFEVIM